VEKYIGVKIISAEPAYRTTLLEDEETKVIVSADLPIANFGAETQLGYRVVYEDGYVSWSPTKVFEEAYRKTDGLTFGLALEAAKKGMGFRLPSWQPDVVIRAQFPEEHSKMTAPYLYVESRFGKVPWKETMIELFSDKWEIIE
jgi:hypothetical protein